MDYVGLFVTKGNTKMLPGSTANVNNDATRRKILMKIKQNDGSEADEFEPDVKDIAGYVQKQLLIGWKTAGKKS